jgi:hypothetical protein
MDPQRKSVVTESGEYLFHIVSFDIGSGVDSENIQTLSVKY